MNIDRISTPIRVFRTVKPRRTNIPQVNFHSCDLVKLKPESCPPVLNRYLELTGSWQCQIGDYSHVNFPSIGTVIIPSIHLKLQ